MDIGYRIFKRHWKNGYATEAAKVCLEFGFNTLELDEIIGRSAKGNSASIHVLEKLKLKFFKFDACNGLENASIYKITRDQFIKDHYS